MATTINFPTSPTIGQSYVYGSITYIWDGDRWHSQYVDISYIESVTGDSVDNTDPLNPVINSVSGVNSDIITSEIDITSDTLTDGGYIQDGKVIGFVAGASINYTIDSSLTTSFVKRGTGNITFLQGSGRTLKTPNGTAILSGSDSSASIVSFGTVDYLYINN